MPSIGDSGSGYGFDPYDDNDGQIVDQNMYEDDHSSKRAVGNSILSQIGGGKEYGFNLADVVDAMVEGDMGDQIPSLQRQITNANVRISAVSRLENVMGQLQTTTLEPLESGLSPYSLSSSNSDVVSASTNNQSKLKSIHPFTVQVSQLAKVNTWMFSTAVDKETDTINGSGTLTISSASTGSKDIIIPKDSSLSDIAKAINDADSNVTASVVKQSDGYRLVISSKKTGKDNELSFSFSPGVDSDNLNTLMTTKTEKQAAVDADYNINGIDMVSSSNDIEYDGINLSLNKAGDSATITTKTDTDGVRKAIQQFVSNYNELNKTLSQLSANHIGKNYMGSLRDDNDLEEIVTNLQKRLQETLPNNETLYALGVAIDENNNGTLTINQSRLDAALDSNPELGDDLFSTQLLTSSSKVDFIGYNKVSDPIAGPETKSGTYDVNVSKLPSAATHTLTNALSINGDDNVVIDKDVTLNMTVSGEDKPGAFDGKSGSVNVAVHIKKGDYTREELAKQIEDQINNTSGVSDHHAQVNVSVVNNHLVFTSKRMGASTSFQIKSKDSENLSELGISEDDITYDDNGKKKDLVIKGTNISGTINGQMAFGDGEYLKAYHSRDADKVNMVNNAEGIILKINASSTGNMGTVTLSRGYADRIDSYISEITHPNDLSPEKSGILARKKYDYQHSVDPSNINSLVEQLKEAKAKKQTLIERYFDRYKGVNAILSKMNSEQQYVNNMFAKPSDNNNE